MLQENYGTPNCEAINSSLLTPNYEAINYEADEPISFLHPQLRAIINEMHDTLGHPKEFLFLSMLVAISTAMGNNYRLKHKEGWYERAILYGVIVGNAGSNKSHPMDFAMRPLIDRDLEVLREARETGDKSEVERRIVSDTTQEGLVALHYRSPQGLALFADELKSWIDNFTRYTSSSSQEQFWLSNFSAKPIFVDRKGEGGSMAIDSPFINVLGSTQPRVLRSFGVGDRGDNGFVDRLLFVIKESNQKPYWSDREPCKELIEGYHELIRSILDDDLEGYNKAPLKEHTLRLSPEAKDKAGVWQRYNADLINNAPDDAPYLGVYSKLELYLLRIALILQVTKVHLNKSPGRGYFIDGETMGSAISIIEYFRDQAMMAQEMIFPSLYPSTTLSDAESRILNQLPESFSFSEAIEIGERNNTNRSKMARIIKRLIKCNAITKENAKRYRRLRS